MPEAMLGRFVSRWQVEVAFEEVRAHLGPFSLVALRMDDLSKAKRIAPRATA